MADQRQPDDDPDYDDDQLAIQKQAHVHSTDEKDAILHVKIDEEVIELNNLRMFSLDEIELSALTHCVVLELRKNLIHKLQPFPQHMRDRLETLDLFDNKIRHIGPYFSAAESPAFAESKLPLIRPDLLPANGGNGCSFRCLKKLDLSYNQISVIAGLDDLGATLEELYLVENRIKVIQGLDKLVNLRLLELGGNQIRDITTGLQHVTNLEELWLGKNKIDTIGSGLHTLRKLKRLSLQANRLTQIPDTVFPAGVHIQLAELYLSENNLQVIENIRHLRALTLLDYSFNPIATLAAAPEQGSELTPENFAELEEFWLTDGQLDSWEQMETIFKPFAASLRTIYLERNPLEKDKRYRNKVLLALPFITQIDSWPVVNRDDPELDRAVRR